MRRRLPAVVLGLATAAAALAACGDDPGAGGRGDDAAPWPAAGSPLPTDAVTWALDGTVHVGDTVLADAPALQAFVVAGDAAWAVPDESTELLLVTADGVERTGTEVEDDSLLASPDGRHVAFLDTSSGERDQYDTPRWEVVVVDTGSGEEVVRTSEGMGDLEDDDLADLYEDATPSLRALTDSTVVVSPTSGDVYALDLATGEPTDPPALTTTDQAPTTSPDGAWSIGGTRDRDRFESADGAVVELSDASPSVVLNRWVDATTAVGFASDEALRSGGLSSATPVRLVTCTVPTGGCTDVAGAAGTLGDLLLPQRGGYVVDPGS